MNSFSRLLAVLLLVFSNISNLESVKAKGWKISRNKKREDILNEEARLLEHERINVEQIIVSGKLTPRGMPNSVFALTPEEEAIINSDLAQIDSEIRENVSSRLHGISFNAKKALFRSMSASLIDEKSFASCCTCFEISDENSTFFKTSCNHVICEDCFLRLILYSKFSKKIIVPCPVCRIDLLKKSDL